MLVLASLTESAEFTYHWRIGSNESILPDLASKERSKESIKCNH